MTVAWVGVGVGVLGLVGNQMNAAKAQRSSGGTSGFDPQVQAGTDQAIQTAETVANTPWTGMDTDQAVAGLTKNQLLAQGGAETSAEYLPAFEATAGQKFDAQTLSQYENPYVQQVLGAQNAMAQRNYQTQLAGLKSREGMTSAFGGDRGAIGENELTSNFNLQSDARNKQGLSDAYNSGVSAFNQDRGFAAGQIGAIEGALGQTGAVAQTTNQNRANFNYNQFKEQRDWTKNQNAYLAQTLGQVPKGQYYTGTQTAYTQPGGGGWMGAAAGAAQLGMQAYQANNQPQQPAFAPSADSNSGAVTIGGVTTGQDTMQPMPAPYVGDTYTGG